MGCAFIGRWSRNESAYGEAAALRYAAFRCEEPPRNHRVARRIAHRQKPKVDDGTDLSLLGEQVFRMEVSVEPDGRAVPRWYLEGCFPRRCHCVGVERAL